MEEFKDRKQYAELTPMILAPIPDDELEPAIIDYIDRVMGDDYKRFYEIVTSLSDGFQMVYAIACVEYQVDNGGFNQFFWNSSGQFAEEALSGFELIGATEHAKLMDQAIAIYVEKLDQQQRLRSEDTNAAYREFCSQTDLRQVDDAYYDLTEDLQALRIQYIREHPEEFRS